MPPRTEGVARPRAPNTGEGTSSRMVWSPKDPLGIGPFLSLTAGSQGWSGGPRAFPEVNTGTWTKGWLGAMVAPIAAPLDVMAQGAWWWQPKGTEDHLRRQSWSSSTLAGKPAARRGWRSRHHSTHMVKQVWLMGPWVRGVYTRHGPMRFMAVV